MNTLVKLIKTYPNADWDYQYLSSNPNISWQTIQKSRRLQNWNGVSCNPSIKFSTIYENLNMPWSWDFVSLNPNITPDIIEQYPELPWNMRAYSQNPNITYEFTKKYPRVHWDYKQISRFSKHATLDMPNISIYSYSANPNLTSDIIKSNKLPWSMFDVGANAIMDEEFIAENKFNPWSLSMNRSVTMEMIERNSVIADKMCYESLGANPSITMEDITNHPEIPWDNFYVSANPNITCEYIVEHIDGINFRELSGNLFKYGLKK